MVDTYFLRNTSVKLNNDEIETLKKSYYILQEIQTKLWENDENNTYAYSSILSVSNTIYTFMKENIGINIDEKR